jgi:hypothetical protein
MLRLSLDTSPSKWREEGQLSELLRIQPPRRLKDAVILASRAVCSDCIDFGRKVNMALRLNIELRGANLCA